MPTDDEAAREQARQDHQRRVAQLRYAITSKVCPSCGAKAFAGSETFKHSLTFRGGGGGMGGGQVYDLQGHCSACDTTIHEMDMR